MFRSGCNGYIGCNGDTNDSNYRVESQETRISSHKLSQLDKSTILV